MERNIKILLVDDISSTDFDVKNALERIGMSPEITFISPKNRTKPIEEELPKPHDLNEYDIALIDLELYSPKDGKYEVKNLSGGMNVLPYLRKHAPWLPVIAASKLFSEENPAMHSLAGSFGFDGQIPRKMFPTEIITKEVWNIIIDQAILLRKKSVLTEEYNIRKSNAITDDNIIEDNSELKEFLNNNFSSYKKLIKDCFFYSDQIFLSKIPGGFSGAITLKAKVIEKNIERSTSGNWLVKISKSPSKLNQEVIAHQRMIRSGQEYARTVPLLWSGVIAEKNIGLIAYQYADNTVTALEFLVNNNAIKLCNELKSLFQGLYNSTKLEMNQNNTFISLINRWFSLENLKKTTELLPNGSYKKVLKIISNGDTPKGVPTILNNTFCWLHGDLHLRNILIGERNVLIDFARSGFGPIVLDLAKYTSDLLISAEEFKNYDIDFSKIYNNTTLFKTLSPITKLFNLNNNDIILFEVLVKIYFAIALGYPDVDDNTKRWIKTLLR